jgi:ferritin-like metal-binding protein YciE
MERKALVERLADLELRLATVQGSYSTEALLREMLAQDVASLQEVQVNLQRDIADTERRIKDVDEVLRRLSREVER